MIMPVADALLKQQLAQKGVSNNVPSPGQTPTMWAGGSPGGLALETGGAAANSGNQSSNLWGGKQSTVVNPVHRGVIDQSALPKYFTGELTAGFNQDQLTAQDWARQTATNQMKTLPGLYDDMIKFGTQDILQEGNPYVEQAIQAAIRPVTENFTNNVLPQLGSQAQRSGAWGGSRQGIIESSAANDLNRTVGDISSSMAYDTYNRNLSMFERMAQLAPMLEQSKYLPVDVLHQVGDQKQQLEQDSIDREKQRYDYNRDVVDEQFLKFSNLLSALSGYGSLNLGGGTTTSGGSTGGGIAGALGGAAQGMQIGQLLGSLF